MTIPRLGLSRDEITRRLEAYRAPDADAAEGRLFSLVYPSRPDVTAVAKDAYTGFFAENALNPMAFPSLRRLESEVLGITRELLHAPPEAAGTMTAGGSESLLLAVKTARDWARAKRPSVSTPEMLLPVTAHPALLKAAHLLDVKPVFVPVGPGFAADVEAARARISDATILVVASAPQYPHGVMDPVADLAALAAERGILCHVDACIGGFLLPWVEKLGRPVPPFDFRVEGVTSISADLHKYGYAAKGASTVVYRTRALRRHQHFVHASWPGGLFGSAGVLGTRPGGAIAAAWAVLHYLGASGYLALTEQALSATAKIARGVRDIPGLAVLGEPVATVLAIGSDGSDGTDLLVLGDWMEARGWRMDRQQQPTSLHLTVSPAHDAVADRFVADLRACSEELRAAPTVPASGAAAMYGMLGALPDRAAVEDALLDFLDGLDA